MALLEEEPRHTTRTLIAVGIPAFILAVALSLVSHQYAHLLVGRSVCGAPAATPALHLIGFHTESAPCAVGALAGPVWTFGLGLLSFALMLRHPHNLFFAAMAFVNATLRLPETLTVFFQLLVHNVAQAGIDEGSSLALLRLHDQTIPTVIMCFYSITILFFALIVVHDIRRIPYKWATAAALFLVLGFVEEAVWGLVGPLFS
jgi:hypothetical protein